MSEQQTQKTKAFQLPTQLVGGVDLNRLIRELEALDDFMYEAGIRTPGTSQTPPRSSHLLEEVASANHYSLLDNDHRTKLLSALKHIDKAAPSIHISFAVDPSPRFMQKVVGWCRQNVNPYLLLEVGLQPTIAIGCFVRTDNKIFDMSLRHKFENNKSELIKKLAKTGENS